MVTIILLDISTIFLLKSYMFAARHAPSPRSLLCGLRVLCLKRSLRPFLDSSPVSPRPFLSAPTLLSLFPQRSEKLNSLFSISSALFKKQYFRNHPNLNHLRTLLQNTGGGVSSATPGAYSLPFFSTVSERSAHTNARNFFSFMRLLHSSLHTRGWGVCGASNLVRIQVIRFRTALARQR